MDFELNRNPGRRGRARRPAAPASESAFELSPQPVLAGEAAPTDETSPRPRASAGPTLCLMARDPRTLFAYWDVDWEEAFREGKPAERKVHLRLTAAAPDSAQVIEIEPLAGSAYLTVEDAGEAYTAEIGFFRPAGEWNALASSDSISTPPESMADLEDSEFATVPFHLSFQRMIDMLRHNRASRETLTEQLADLRERFDLPEQTGQLSAPERELAHTLRQLETAVETDRPRDLPRPQKQKRLERILGFGGSSPGEGFGGASENSALGGSSRAL